MDNYRIMTNGFKFAIQYKVKRWFNRGYKWKYHCYYPGPYSGLEVWETTCAKKAAILIQTLIKIDEENTAEWKVYHGEA